MTYEKPTTYFEATGETNTDKTLEVAKKRAQELGIKDIVVASTRDGRASRPWRSSRATT
jgi:hypothetical protein